MIRKTILLYIMLILILSPANAYAAPEKDGKINFVQSIGGVDDKLVQEFNDSYMLIPENVRERFEEDGWKIYATTENLGQKYYGKKMSILALTVTDEQAIYIDDREKARYSVIHEMGHYIDFSSDFVSGTEEFEEIFNEEADDFRSFHETHKNNTSTAVEYFAESYQAMITETEEMMEKCPKTYQFIAKYADAF